MAESLREQFAGVALPELARAFGTPLYVYDAERIVARIADLAAFDVIRYAQKANSNLALLDLCRRHGVVVDAVSAGEVWRALSAGYAATGTPPPIVYTADVFDRAALDEVVARNIRVNCGSLDMISQYGERASASAREITVRVNPGFGHGHSRKTNTGGEHSKHGIWHEELGAALALAARHNLRVTGLHLHIGSGTDFEHLQRVADALEKLAPQLGDALHMISAGGGLPVAYRKDAPTLDIQQYFQRWDETRRRIVRRLGHAVTLEVEPGRYLVAEAGALLCEVRAVKRSGRNTFVLLDAGFNALARPVLYGSYHPMSVCAVTPEPRAPREVVVGGPLCESGDVFTQSEDGVVLTRELPAPRVGDLLLIEHAGAYGFVMGSNYNARPLPAEVLVTNGRPALVRERQSLEDLTRGEHIPRT